MDTSKMLNYIKEVLENMPSGWLSLTTHRLDIYDEKLAKTQFLEHFESLFNNNNAQTAALNNIPTAFDYIRLGHPLSCILEWAIAQRNGLNPNNVISFSSKTIPILAVLRKNLLDQKNTQILYTDPLPNSFDAEVLKNVYGYQFELKKIGADEAAGVFEGSTIFIAQEDQISTIDLNPNVDFYITLHNPLGSILLVNGEHNERYISEFSMSVEERPLP